MAEGVHIQDLVLSYKFRTLVGVRKTSIIKRTQEYRVFRTTYSPPVKIQKSDSHYAKRFK